MALLSDDEILIVVKQFGHTKYLKVHFEEFEDKMIGYLGDHLKLIIEVEKSGVKEDIKLFVKCLPRTDIWKSEYLKELMFFKKEHVMLSSLFKQFQEDEGAEKWRPKVLLLREDLFIFEDISVLGYVMPNNCETLTYAQLEASIKTLARFHASSYILEEKKSKELQRPYRIYEEYGYYLQEPVKGQPWRDTGRNAVVDILKVFSMHSSNTNVMQQAEIVIPTLFDEAMRQMKPSTKYRNVVVHRDLWSNNILIKKQEEKLHALFVDFQTVLYGSPMLDLTSLIYMNTTRKNRRAFSDEFIDIYYNSLNSILKRADINIADIFTKEDIIKTYNESLVFGMTQAALIVPIVAMKSEKRDEIFCDPEKSVKANVESRSEEFIELARNEKTYCVRVSELFDEIVERFVLHQCC